MAIEQHPGGSITITGGHIEVYRLLALKAALSLECKGIKMTRGRSAYSIVKRELGFKGNKARVLAQLVTLCETVLAQGQAGGEVQ